MEAEDIQYKDLKAGKIKIDAKSLQIIAIAVIGTIAITALPSSSLKLKALTATMTAIASLKI